MNRFNVESGIAEVFDSIIHKIPEYSKYDLHIRRDWIEMGYTIAAKTPPWMGENSVASFARVNFDENSITIRHTLRLIEHTIEYSDPKCNALEIAKILDDLLTSLKGHACCPK